MKIKGIDFPRPILNALRDGRLVIFAGAGVSMGAPANLPGFRGLAKAIARGTGHTLQCHEREDEFLGMLEHNGTHVHERAREELSQAKPQPTELHRDLLRLYTTRGSSRIVTTNFDLLFETAAKGVQNSQPAIIRAPTLPLGRECEGIVHVHGTLDGPNGMVLTDKDFGSAYLTDGWALRFLVELFQSFTVLFVGYSHSDTIMNYLARALSGEQAQSRFALANEDDDRQWQLLGIEPIRYTKSPGDNHCALYKGVSGLADYASRSILDWQREITEIAGKPPPLDEEEIDLIKEALSDESKTRFFTAAAVTVEWVGWLDKHNYLVNLFGTSELSECDGLMGRWLAERFAYSHPDELFLLIGRRYVQPHPKFWDALCRSIALQDDPAYDLDTLSRWVSLLLATAPAGLEKEHPLFWLGECCVKNELLDRVVDVFDAMAASQLVVKRGISWPDADGEEQSRPMDVECSPVTSHYTINELWIKELKPNLDRVADQLLATVIRRLTAQHRTLSTWQVAARDRSPVSYGRSAIEPHDQDEDPETVDVLIDAARDCLEWLASNRPKIAALWHDQLVRESSPLLRRLAVHTLSVSRDLNPNEKIDWLFGRVELHDLSLHHELFQLMKSTYPRADEDHRRTVIEAISAYRPRSEEDENTENDGAAYYHFNWFHWLDKAAPDCPIAKAALENVLRRNPDFQPREHPDLTHWTSFVRGGHLSPRTAAELLSKPAENWIEELLSFRQTDVSGLDRFGLLDAVSAAVGEKFKWGLDLADGLIARTAWETDLWHTLIRVWSESELAEESSRRVLKRLEMNQLHKNNSRQIAGFIFTLVKDGGTLHTYSMLAHTDKIATKLWRQVDNNEPTSDEFNRWLTKAINNTGGILANYWLHRIQYWRSHQEPKPTSITEDYKKALTTIVRDDTIADKLGRCVLAGNLPFLLGVDRKWTETHLIPLFSQHHKGEDYQAVWDGFLHGRLSPAVAELMGESFLVAVSGIESEFTGEGQKLFVQRYVDMISYFVENPLDVWIPKFFDHADECARRTFALHIGVRLSEMSDVQQQEWWERWLKLYWANRLNGVPKALDGGEVESMLRCLPNLEAVFVEAVELAIRMPTEKAKQDVEVLYRIKESDLCENHPESVAKLLVYLEHISSESYARTGERELIGILRNADIPDRLKLELEELAARRGYT